MADDFIPVNVPQIGPEDREALAACIDSGWIGSEGPQVAAFERAIADWCGRRHGIAVSNGSAALDAAVAALDLAPGDKVILPTFTIISCAAAIVRAGLVPVPVDCDAETWTIDLPQAERAAEDPRVRAIMPVHIYGLPCDMPAILGLAARRGLKIIEDAAEAHGVTCHGRRCGGFGDLSTFSFYPNKLITTGEGGMILTDDDALAARCRGLRNLCFGPRRFVHEELGWNLRMSSLQAALGLSQFSRAEAFLARKRAIGALYDALLADAPHIRRPLATANGGLGSYWVYGVVLDDAFPLDAEAVIARLADAGIGARPFFWPMHEQPVFRRMGLFDGLRLPVAERIARRGFYLPGGLGSGDDDFRRAAAALRRILESPTR